MEKFFNGYTVERLVSSDGPQKCLPLICSVLSPLNIGYISTKLDAGHIIIVSDFFFCCSGEASNFMVIP